MVGGYEAFDDPYLYPGTLVLKNLLGIEDALILEAAEIEMTTLRSEQPLPQGRFDANHYRGIHRHLFQDVYQWAGEYRTVRIAKGDSIFCYPENIPSQMQRLFGSIDGGIRFLNRAPEEFAAELARFLAELNAIHPFREGNGRAQLSCAGLIGETFDHPLRLEAIDPRTFLSAMLAGFAGDLKPLTEAVFLLLRSPRA